MPEGVRIRCEHPVTKHHAARHAVLTGKVVHYEKLVKAASWLKYQLWCKRWFRFPELDINVPRGLWKNFEEYLPLFNNRCIPDDPRAKPESSVGSLTGRSCSSPRLCNGVWSTTWRSRPCIELSTTGLEGSSPGSLTK